MSAGVVQVGLNDIGLQAQSGATMAQNFVLADGTNSTYNGGAHFTDIDIETHVFREFDAKNRIINEIIEHIDLTDPMNIIDKKVTIAQTLDSITTTVIDNVTGETSQSVMDANQYSLSAKQFFLVSGTGETMLIGAVDNGFFKSLIMGMGNDNTLNQTYARTGYAKFDTGYIGASQAQLDGDKYAYGFSWHADDVTQAADFFQIDTDIDMDVKGIFIKPDRVHGRVAYDITDNENYKDVIWEHDENGFVFKTKVEVVANSVDDSNSNYIKLNHTEFQSKVTDGTDTTEFTQDKDKYIAGGGVVRYGEANQFTNELDLIDRRYADGGGIKNFQYPDGWEFKPFNIFETNGKFYVDKSCSDIVKDKVADMVPYYIDYENGSDSNPGISANYPFKTIPYALSQGARLIYLRSGDTIQFDGFGGTIAGSSYSNEDLFFISQGGEKKTTIINNMLNPIFTLSSGTTYTASVTGNTIDNVMDKTFTDEFGFPSLLEQVANSTLVLTTPGSYNVTGTTIYVNTIDGRVPDTSLFLIKNANPIFFSVAADVANYIYTEGISFVGGASAFKIGSTVNTSPTAKINYLSKNCEYIYSGLDGYNFEKSEGLTWIENCVAYKNRRDGFNYKQQGNDSLATAYFNAMVIEVNCYSFNNGYKRTISNCNGSSAHQYHKHTIRIGGKYWGNRGPNIVDVRATETIIAGTECFDSIGTPIIPTPASGGNWAYNADFAVGTLAGEAGCKMYIYGCKSRNTDFSFHTPEFLDDGVTPDPSEIFVDTCLNWAEPVGTVTAGAFGIGDPSPVLPAYPALSAYTPNPGKIVTDGTSTSTTSQTPTSVATTVTGALTNSSIVQGSNNITETAETIYNYAGATSLELSNTGTLIQSPEINFDGNINARNIIVDAGTSSIAPLKLTSGVNTSTPENGAIEYNGTNYFATAGGVRSKIAMMSDTGWASYTDTAYTVGSPFTILDTVQSTLPNNAGSVINSELPAGVTSFYNSGTSKITPQLDGDYNIFTIRFKAKNSAALGGYMDFGIDIGGSLGVIFKETFVFPKGAGIEHNFTITCPGYSAATFVANGGLVKITAGNGDLTIYDIEFQISRTHKKSN